MKQLLIFVASSCLILSAGYAAAQTIDTGIVASPKSPDSAAAPMQVRVPAGTSLQLEFTQTLNSQTSKMGETFALKLAEPLVLDGRTIIPAGAIGGGEVIDASRKGMGGRSGKLIVSGRYLETSGQRIRIRGLQSVLSGTDRSRTAVNTMILVPYVGFLGSFINGGDIEITAGTRAQAQIAADTILSIASPAEQVVTPNPATP